MSRQEWDALEWWEQRNYLEGYEDEVAERDDDGVRKDGKPSPFGDVKSGSTQQGDGETAFEALFGDGTKPNNR